MIRGKNVVGTSVTDLPVVPNNVNALVLLNSKRRRLEGGSDVEGDLMEEEVVPSSFVESSKNLELAGAGGSQARPDQ